jgi:hypothetical protein
MVSAQLAGHRVEILDEAGDWLLARGADGYEGWMHTGFISLVSEYSNNDDCLISLGCRTVSGTGAHRNLPLRAMLAPDEKVESGEAIGIRELAQRFPATSEAIAGSAQEYFAGTSYLWGGVTPWGGDCSGLSQAVFALHGIQLPRDAWQQAELGADAGRDVGDLVAGDLLFFSDREDRRITHVGISLGDRRMAHLSLARGGYAIEQLSDRRDPIVDRLRERFLFARRYL